VGSEIIRLQGVQRLIPNQAGEVDARGIPTYAPLGDDPISGRQSYILSAEEPLGVLSRQVWVLHVYHHSMVLGQLLDRHYT